jgi:hypothetical protein
LRLRTPPEKKNEQIQKPGGRGSFPEAPESSRLTHLLPTFNHFSANIDHRFTSTQALISLFLKGKVASVRKMTDGVAQTQMITKRYAKKLK